MNYSHQFRSSAGILLSLCRDELCFQGATAVESVWGLQCVCKEWWARGCISEIIHQQTHRIIQWFGLEGTLQTISFQPPAMGRDPFHQTRVLRAPSNLALNTAREGAAIASLGNLGQGLTTLMVKNFFLIFNLDLPSFSLKPSPLVASLQALVTAPLQLSHSPSRPWQLL